MNDIHVIHSKSSEQFASTLLLGWMRGYATHSISCCVVQAFRVKKIREQVDTVDYTVGIRPNHRQHCNQLQRMAESVLTFEISLSFCQMYA